MYKFLIADDEEWIRKGIAGKLGLYGFDIECIVEASDGEEALRLIKQHQPDIVFADIRMPYMDGLEVAKKAMEFDPAIQCVIITGYAEFEYARQALDTGVAGFIVKPVNDDKFVELVNKVINNIERNKNIVRTRDTVNYLQEDNYLLRVEKEICQLLYNTLSNSEVVLEQQLFVEELNKKYKYCLAIFSVFGLEKSKFIQSKLNIKRTMKHMKGIFLLEDPKYSSYLLALFASHDEKALNLLCSRFVTDLSTKLKEIENLSVTVGISGICDKLNSELYNQAKTALNLRLLNENSNTYKYSDKNLKRDFEMPRHKLNALHKSIHERNYQNIKKILSDIFAIENIEKESIICLKLLYAEVINEILKAFIELNCSFEDIFGEDIISGKIIDESNSLSDIADIIYISTVDVLIGSVRQDGCKNIVFTVKKYIEANYSDSLSVKDLSDRFSLNPNYLSTIFKAKIGYTISEHITRVRISKASQLLYSTNSKISEVAECVGYKDPLYFCKVFKQLTGCTPKEFRGK